MIFDPKRATRFQNRLAPIFLHLLDLDVIAKVLPDAGFVWTHRDPYELVPSFLSTAACIRSGTHPWPLDLPRLAENCLEMVDVAHDRAMKSEVVRQGDRILHVSYEYLVRDPVAAATEICERFDLALNSPLGLGLLQATALRLVALSRS